MLALPPNQLRRSTKSLHGSATTSSESEKFRVNPFANVFSARPSCWRPSLCYRLRFSPGGGPHHSVRAGMGRSGVRTLCKTRISRARGLLASDLASVKGKRFGNNCLKGMNIGSGWERKSIMQRCPFIFIIRTENRRNNQTVGRKSTLRLRTSFRKPQALTLSSLALRNRQQPARIGCWRMVSDKVAS